MARGTRMWSASPPSTVNPMTPPLAVQRCVCPLRHSSHRPHHSIGSTAYGTPSTVPPNSWPSVAVTPSAT